MDLLCLCLFTLFDELYITNSLVRKPCSFVNQIQAKIFSMLFRHTKKKNKENSFLNLAWYSFTSLVTNYATCMTTLLLLHTKIRKIIFTNTLTNRSYSISRRSRKNNYVNITFSWLLGHPWRPTDYEQQFTENRHIPTDCKTCHLTTWPLTSPQPYEIIILIRWAQLPKQSFL